MPSQLRLAIHYADRDAVVRLLSKTMQLLFAEAVKHCTEEEKEVIGIKALVAVEEQRKAEAELVDVEL